jgi:hypothetical protein
MGIEKPKLTVRLCEILNLQNHWAHYIPNDKKNSWLKMLGQIF